MTIVLSVLMFIILVILISQMRSENKKTLLLIERTIGLLSNEVYALRNELNKKLRAGIPPESPAVQEAREPEPLKAQAETMLQPVVPPIFIPEIKANIPEPVPQAEPEIEAVPPVQEPQPAEPQPAPMAVNPPEPQFQQPPQPAKPPMPPQPKRDMEKYIGENLFNKIGITVLVLGIAFFVKYAIDKNWIGETGRVITGLICGGILIGIAHWLRNSYRSFSSVLAGGGIATFYFTIAFAFHEYKLIEQTPAFIVMVIITAFGVALSVLYNRMELAILATVGGFLTPFLVSTGSGNYIVLFSYMAILNSGLMVLAWFRRWPVLYGIAMAATLLIYGFWLGMKADIDAENIPFANALLFATIFYFQFIVMALVNNLRYKRQLVAYDFIILLLANAAYFSAGMIILHFWNDGAYRGLFTASLGAVNLALAFWAYRAARNDKNLVYLLIGLTLSFLSLAAPVQLNGHHITLFWAAEAVVLYWLFQRSGIRLMKIASVLVAILALISLVMDWWNTYLTFGRPGILPVIANKGFITSVTVAAAYFIYAYMLWRKKAENYANGVSNQTIGQILISFGSVIMLAAGAMEIQYQFSSRLPDTQIEFSYLHFYLFGFLLLLFAVLKRLRIPFNSWLRFGPALFFFMLFLTHSVSTYSSEKLMLAGELNKIHFLGYWGGVGCIAVLIWTSISHFRQQSSGREVFTWICSLLSLLLVSIAMHRAFIWFMYSDAASLNYVENMYRKAGLTIVWALCSFVLMWLGMRYRYRPLRLVSLVLFGITLLKLFILDLVNIAPGGKIAAFILLGVLLLIVSFMYQRVKKIIIDDERKS